MDNRPNRWGRRVVACGVVCALVVAQTPPARAEPPPAKAAGAANGPNGAVPKADLATAKKHYGDGEKKYKAADYTGALSEFEQANDIKPTPHAERYLGLCEDNLGHYQAAADWYDKFLAHVPDKLAAQGDEIRKRSAEIKAMPGKLHIDSTPEGASVSIDDRPQASMTPLDVELAPGTHALRLTGVGRSPAVRSMDVAFASTQSVQVELEPQPAAAPAAPVAAALPAAAPAATPAPAPSEPRSKVPAIVTGGLAIAAAGVGTVFGIIALGDKSDFDKNPTTSTADSGDTHALIADMAFGVALTFGVTSAVLFLTKDEPPASAASGRRAETAKAEGSQREPKSAMTLTPTPIVGPHVGGAGLVLRF